MITDDQVRQLEALEPEKRLPVVLMWLFAAGVIDDDAYTRGIELAADDAIDFGGSPC